MDTIYSTNRKFKRMFVNILSIFIILAMAFPVTGNVYAEELNPFFRAFPDANAIDGGDWPLGATVHMAIDDPATVDDPDYWDDATVVVSDEGWISTYVRFDFEGAYDLKRGDEVTLSMDGFSRYQIVPNLWVTALDVENNIIGGVFEGAEAGTTVHVFIGSGAQLYVTTDADGAWAADFDDVGFDLLSGMEGAVEVWFDEFNDSTIFNWNLPWLTAFPENDAVEGWEWPEGAIVYLTIDKAPGLEWSGTAAVTTWGDPRTYVRIEFWEEYDLQVGDTVTLTDEFGTTTTHTVQNLTVTKANHDDNTIKGIADPGAEVYVWPHATGEQRMAIAKAQGKWNVDFSGIYDLTPGECGRSEIRDEGANSTAVDWCISNPRIVASESGDWFWTTEFKPGDLDISIYDSADEGATLLWSGQQVADEWGFTIVGSDIHGQDLVPGNYLVVSDGNSMKSLVLQPTSVTMFDTEYDFMAGVAPAGSEVWAAAGPQEWQQRIFVEADPVSGIWSADFAAIGFDITEDMQPWSYSHIYDEDGDANEGSVPPLETWVAYFTSYDYETWSEGSHSYHFKNTYAFPVPGSEGPTPDISFTITDDAPSYTGYVLLRPHGLRAQGNGECPLIDPYILPDQATRFVYGWLIDYPMTYEEAVAHFDSMTVTAYWDGDQSAELVRHDILPFELGNACIFTE